MRQCSLGAADKERPLGQPETGAALALSPAVRAPCSEPQFPFCTMERATVPKARMLWGGRGSVAVELGLLLPPDPEPSQDAQAEFLQPKLCLIRAGMWSLGPEA